jgi:hypothetical protein
MQAVSPPSKPPPHPLIIHSIFTSNQLHPFEKKERSNSIKISSGEANYFSILYIIKSKD